MEIELENVGAIKKGTITFDDNKINIIYGSNGIGKTTILAALQAKLNDAFDNASSPFVPFFNKSAQPKITLNNCSISSILTFNRNYVDLYLYNSEDIANNSYSLMAKTQNYDNQIQTINQQIADVRKSSNVPILNEFCNTINKVQSNIDFNAPKNGQVHIKANSKIGKSLKEQIKQEVELNSSLSKYSAFKGILSWIDWIKTGIDIIGQTDAKICPFCGSNLTDDVLHDVHSISSKGTSKKFQSNVNARNTLLAINRFANEEGKKVITNFCDKKEPLGNVDASYLKSSIERMEKEAEKISRWQNWLPVSASNIDQKELLERIAKSKIDLSIFDGSSKELLDALNTYNNSLEKLGKEAHALAADLSKLNTEKSKLIDCFKKPINQFLKLSGIPYEVSVELLDDKASTHLRYNGVNENVDDVKKSLSYGEYNAIALCLFALEAISKNNALIALDDPISSYDSEKRASILISLFCDKNSGLCLKGKTIVILTHDFETLVPFFKWPRLNAKEQVSAWHLISKNNELTENRIDESQIKNMAVLEKEMAKNEKLPFLIRVVHLRKYYQLIDFDGDEYQFLSCLMHEDAKHEKPVVKIGGQFQDMDKEKITSVETKLKEFLGEGNFDKWKEEIGDNQSLLQTYRNETNDYNKLIIARQIIRNQFENEINQTLLKTYITDTYHVDSEHIFGFESQFDNVPRYILDICDDTVNKIVQETKAK